MEIRTLEGVSFASIAETFNLAFSDYKIKFSLTEDSVRHKFLAENIKPQGSAGAFNGERLVGLILHGLDEIDGQERVFNAGTGVVPQYRGQHIADQMYTYILPLLKEQGYRHHQLEVLQDNAKARQVYRTLGFKDVRELACFKGSVKKGDTAAGVVIHEVPSLDWAHVKTFWDIEPTWQNNCGCIQRALARYKLLAAYLEGELTGYAAVDTGNGRLKQFAVKHNLRGRGVGTALLRYVSENFNEVNFINYDMSDTRGVALFKKLGLEQDYEMFEMKMVY